MFKAAALGLGLEDCREVEKGEVLVMSSESWPLACRRDLPVVAVD